MSIRDKIVKRLSQSSCTDIISLKKSEIHMYTKFKSHILKIRLLIIVYKNETFLT